jgi:hypothetical protein
MKGELRLFQGILGPDDHGIFEGLNVEPDWEADRRYWRDSGPAWCLIGRCRRCSCTDQRGCCGGCYWIEPTLCSRCARFPERRRFRRERWLSAIDTHGWGPR